MSEREKNIRDKAEPASHWFQELRRLAFCSGSILALCLKSVLPSSPQPQALIRLQCTALFRLPRRVLEAESRSDLSLGSFLSCFNISSFEMWLTYNILPCAQRGSLTYVYTHKTITLIKKMNLSITVKSFLQPLCDPSLPPSLPTSHLIPQATTDLLEVTIH